jgi:hypothetical protein
MFDRKRTRNHTVDRDGDTHVVKGAGLARGPALILGTILAVAGLILWLHSGDVPRSGFPDADATGTKILGFESNGWTAFFTTTAGIVLLFAAAQHLLAKVLGLVVGLALAACVVLDLVDGPGVLGLAAANWAVDLGWGIAAVILLLNVFAPRITHEEPVVAGTTRRHDDRAVATTAAAEHHRTHDGAVGRDRDRDRDRDGVLGDRDRTRDGVLGDGDRTHDGVVGDRDRNDGVLHHGEAGHDGVVGRGDGTTDPALADDRGTLGRDGTRGPDGLADRDAGLTEPGRAGSTRVDR